MTNHDYIDGRFVRRREVPINAFTILALGVGVVFGVSLMSLLFLIFG